MNEDKNYSALMLLHCEKILTKMEGKTLDDWWADENLRDAVFKLRFRTWTSVTLLP